MDDSTSLFDTVTGSISSAANSAASLFSQIAGVQNTISNTQTAQEIAKLQAQAQLAAAQGQLSTVQAAYSNPSTNAILNALSGLSQNNGLMLALAIGGLILAYLQFEKR